MINIKEIVRQMKSNAETMRSLVETIPIEQALWKPDRQTWCMKDVMEHIYNEERFDFRQHILEMFNDPPQAWGTRPMEHILFTSCQQALEAFLIEREASLEWLRSLSSANWDISTSTTFGQGEVLVLRAGDVLVSWVAHDFLHIRQLNELHYAWIEKQAKPYSVQYAGGW